jgi:hypothetical protein
MDQYVGQKKGGKHGKSLMAIEKTIKTMKYSCRARKIEKSVHQNIR